MRENATDYMIEELIPIVEMLADKYTSKDSSSISYEQAEQLMEAVLYCIRHCGKDNQLTGSEKLPANEAYQIGFKNLFQKVRKTQELYNEMVICFKAYGNENYCDTVIKAIPGFFRYYDIRFAPQKTLITMDYPILCPSSGSGIDAIENYISCISLEQKFMGALPDEYVYKVLYHFQSDYRNQFYNICSIMLRHVLGHMLLGKRLGEASADKDYIILRKLILEHDSRWLEVVLIQHLHTLIKEKYHQEKMLEYYLQSDIKDFVTELRHAANHDVLRRVLVL